MVGKLSVLGFLGIAITLTACSQTVQQPAPPNQPVKDTPQAGGILNLVSLSDPPTLDIHQAGTQATTLVVQPAMQPLVRYDPLSDPNSPKVEPNLAERWDISSDGMTYTFLLRKGVRFHNGDELTVKDVQYSFERQMNPEAGQVMQRRDLLAPIASFATIDDYTLKITMKRPYPSFLANIALGWFVILDKQWVQAGHDPAKEVNGTGPFIFKEYIRGTSVDLPKNPIYWKKGFPYLDGLKYFIIPDASTGFAACRTGQVLTCSVTPDQQKQLASTVGDKVRFEKGKTGMGANLVHFNTKVKPFDDIRVRTALVYAVDRNAAIAVLHDGQGVNQAFMPTGGPWAMSSTDLAKFPGYGPDAEKNRAEAKRLLAEAGYPTGFSVTLPWRQVTGYDAPSIFLKDQWAKIGVIGTLKSLESTLAYEALEKGNYEIMEFLVGLRLDDPDSVFGEHLICNGTRNYQKLCISELDDLFNKQTVTNDPAERKRLVTQMETLALNQLGKFSLPVPTGNATGIWNTLRDWRPGDTHSTRHFEQSWLSK